MALLALLALLLSEAAADYVHVKAGEKVTLNCNVSTDRIRAVEWLKDEQPPKVILFYRDGHQDQDLQDSSWLSRVELADQTFKDGNVSLSLKNVSVTDNGTYKCFVAMGDSRRRKRANVGGEPARIIHLKVTGPPSEYGRVYVGSAAALALLVGVVGVVGVVGAVGGISKCRRHQDRPAAGPLFGSLP